MRLRDAVWIAAWRALHRFVLRHEMADLHELSMAYCRTCNIGRVVRR